MKKIIASLFIMGLIAYGVISSYSDTKEKEEFSSQAASETQLKKGGDAPAFSLKTLSGKEVSLEDLKGKKVMLNFWASWCPPCKAEMPEMQEFHENFKEKDVAVIAVNATQTEKSQADVKKFVEEYGLTFEIPMDTNGFVNSNLYNVVSLPTTYSIDSQGKMQKQVIGAMTYDQMVSNIESMK